MKTLTKIALIFGLTLFMSGTLLALVCLALGGQPKLVGDRLNQMGVTNIYYDFGHYGRFNDGYSYNSDNDYDYDYDYGYYSQESEDMWQPEAPFAPEESFAPDAPESLFAPDAPLIPSDTEITQLNFSFGVGDIKIIEGDDFELRYGNSNSRRYFYEMREGDTWYIGSEERRWGWFDSWRWGRDTLRLTVVVPRDFVAENVNIEMGAGNLQAGSLAALNFTLDAGVGNCQIEQLSTDKAQLTVGVGNLEIRNFHTAEGLMDVAMGSANLRMAQPLNQYRCNVDVGLGSVTLGRSTYSGVAQSRTGSDDSPYRFDISCGMGSIHVSEAATVNI